MRRSARRRGPSASETQPADNPQPSPDANTTLAVPVDRRGPGRKRGGGRAGKRNRSPSQEGHEAQPPPKRGRGGAPKRGRSGAGTRARSQKQVPLEIPTEELARGNSLEVGENGGHDAPEANDANLPYSSSLANLPVTTDDTHDTQLTNGSPSTATSDALPTASSVGENAVENNHSLVVSPSENLDGVTAEIAVERSPVSAEEVVADCASNTSIPGNANTHPTIASDHSSQTPIASIDGRAAESEPQVLAADVEHSAELQTGVSVTETGVYNLRRAIDEELLLSEELQGQIAAARRKAQESKGLAYLAASREYVSYAQENRLIMRKVRTLSEQLDALPQPPGEDFSSLAINLARDEIPSRQVRKEMVSKRAAFYEQAKRDCTVAAHYYVEDPCEESEINLAAASDVEKDASNFLEQAKASLGRWDNLYRSAIHKANVAEAHRPGDGSHEAGAQAEGVPLESAAGQSETSATLTADSRDTCVSMRCLDQASPQTVPRATQGDGMEAQHHENIVTVADAETRGMQTLAESGSFESPVHQPQTRSTPNSNGGNVPSFDRTYSNSSSQPVQQPVTQAGPRSGSIALLPDHMRKVVATGTTVKALRSSRNDRAKAPAPDHSIPSDPQERTEVDVVSANIHAANTNSHTGSSRDGATRCTTRTRTVRFADLNERTLGSIEDGDQIEDADDSDRDPTHVAGSDDDNDDDDDVDDDDDESLSRAKNASKSKTKCADFFEGEESDATGASEKLKPGPISKAVIDKAMVHIKAIENIARDENKSIQAILGALGVQTRSSRSTGIWNKFCAWYAANDKTEAKDKLSKEDYTRRIAQEYKEKKKDPVAKEFFLGLEDWYASVHQVDINTTKHLAHLCEGGAAEFRSFAQRELENGNVWLGLRVNVSDNPRSKNVRGFIPGTAIATSALEDSAMFFTQKAIMRFESCARFHLSPPSLPKTHALDYKRPTIDLPDGDHDQTFLRSVVSKYLNAALKYFLQGRATPNDRVHLTKPIIQQLFDKKIGLINFPHGVDARLTCAGNKTFSWEHFTLQPKSFPTSASKKSEKKGVRLASGEKKGPLQLLAEPIIEEQVAMRDGAPIPKGLKVIDFIDLTGEFGKHADVWMNVPVITTCKDQVLLTVRDCIRNLPSLRAEYTDTDQAAETLNKETDISVETVHAYDSAPGTDGEGV